MGSDLTVVNAARVSFHKESHWLLEGYGELDEEGDLKEYGEKTVLSVKDQKLISYLAKNNHWTPFSHVMITMREKVPIFVARQRFKHMVGFTYNEVSRRYVDEEPEFYVPSVWRERAENKKQGSSDKTFDPVIQNILYSRYVESLEIIEELYKDMIEVGVAPEQARMILPQSMYTEYYCTGSLAAWARAYKLRSDSHSQLEIQELASKWNEVISGIDRLECSWKALTQ